MLTRLWIAVFSFALLAFAAPCNAQRFQIPGENALASVAQNEAPQSPSSADELWESHWIRHEQLLHEYLAAKNFDAARKVVGEIEALSRGRDPKRDWRVCLLPQLRSDVLAAADFKDAERNEFATAIKLITKAADEMSSGDFKDGSTNADRAMNSLKGSLGEKSFFYQRALYILVISKTLTEDFKEARELNDKLIRLRKDLFGDDTILHAQDLNSQAAIRIGLGNWKDAEACIRESMRITRKLFGSEHSEYIYALCLLAELQLTQGLLEEGDACAQHALGLSFVVGQDDALKARAYELVARSHSAFGEHELAVKYLSISVSLSTEKIPELWKDRSRRLELFAASLRSVGNVERANIAQRQAESLRARSSMPR